MNITYLEKEIPDIVLPRLIEILSENFAGKSTVFLGLSGDLGAGKTTLTKHLLKHFGITGSVASPTFVLRRDYLVNYTFENGKTIHRVIHIDAYRLEKPADLLPVIADLHTQNAEDNGCTLVLVEWPEMTDIFYDITFKIEHVDEETRRILM
jgi:tRNA threonylcarbamoyladenosine biosynthesis protein TsaE